MWGTSPVPTAPALGLPPWAPASQDLVPTTCLPPALPSSSSFASVTPSPQVGGLCPCRPCSPLAVWLCVCLPPTQWCLRPRPAPGARCVPGGLRLAGLMVGVVRVCGLGAVPRFSLPSARSWQRFLTVFSSLCALLSPILPVSLAFLSPHNGLPLPFLRPGPFFALSSLLLLSPLPSFLDFLTFSSPSLPPTPSPVLLPRAPSRWRSCCSPQ